MLYLSQMWPVITGVTVSAVASIVIRFSWRRGKSAADI